MSSIEIWCLVAVILAGAGAVLHLLAAHPRLAGAPGGLGAALTAAAVGCVAVALMLALP